MVWISLPDQLHRRTLSPSDGPSELARRAPAEACRPYSVHPLISWRGFVPGSASNSWQCSKELSFESQNFEILGLSDLEMGFWRRVRKFREIRGREIYTGVSVWSSTGLRMVHLCPYVATSIKMNVIKIFFIFNGKW